MARRPFSSWLSEASRADRDFEVLASHDSAKRYAKRRPRRVVRRKGLGWWFKKTGL